MGRIISNGIDFSGLNLLTPMCFSMDERVVGCWTDGKPLYQKTYTISMSSRPENTVTVDSNFANKTLITFKINPDGIANTKVGYNGSISDTLYEDNDILYYYLSKSGQWWSAFDTADLTIWYTKDTDTAGSGIWTPSGMLAVHYSTEEQVIGTWIDGSTLYEKTIHTGALSTGENDIAHNISNIDHLISASGKFIYSTYENVFPFVSIGQNSWNVSFAGFNSTNVIIEVGSSYTSTYAVTDSYTTIQYTKST